MAETEAIVITDGAIFASVVHRALDEHFGKVTVFANVNGLVTADDWSGVIIIVDTPDIGSLPSSLKTLSSKNVDLNRVIVMVRGPLDGKRIAPLIGQIGALLPSALATPEIIQQVSQVVSSGLMVCPTTLVHQMIALMNDAEAPLSNIDAGNLTERETEVLALLAEGSGNKDIGRRLNISESTVRVHVRSVLKKLGTQNRTQAALWAVRSKVVASHSNPVKFRVVGKIAAIAWLLPWLDQVADFAAQL